MPTTVAIREGHASQGAQAPEALPPSLQVALIHFFFNLAGILEEGIRALHWEVLNGQRQNRGERAGGSGGALGFISSCG